MRKAAARLSGQDATMVAIRCAWDEVLNELGRQYGRATPPLRFNPNPFRYRSLASTRPSARR